ncbi:hypothetical protein Tco_0983916, partial [Tanacetum coccineum]
AAPQSPGPEHPPSPDYVPGPEHSPSPDYVPGLEHPPSPVYVPEPEYPEYLVPSEDEAPMEDQPLPDDTSPAALSSGYIADSDPEEDPKEDLEEDPADYPADRGDDDESSDDEDDDDGDDGDDDDVEEDEEDKEDEEGEEHLAPTIPFMVPVVDPVPSAGDTDAFETDESAATQPPPPAYHTSARMAAGIRWRAASPPTHQPLEIPSPLLLLSSPAHRDDIPEVDMPLQKRAYFTAPTSRYEVRESSSAVTARQTRHTLAHRVDYGFVDNVDTSIRASESRAMTAIVKVYDRVTDLATTQRRDAQELYARCEDAQDDRALLGAHVSILRRERRYFRSMASSYECEAVIARQAWDEDRLTAHIQHDHERFRDLVRAAEAGPQDGPADAGSSC